MKGKKVTLLVALTLPLAVALNGQGLYDDIYYNPKTDTKKAETVIKRGNTSSNGVYYRSVADYPAADTYTVVTKSTRNVDEYNRRGIFATADSVPADSTQTDNFAYTRRIEQFYNPAIVSGSNDDELATLYYAEPANVNIYVNSPGYWGWNYPYYGYGWGSPWYGPSWYGNRGSGPSWSGAWNWGWGHSWGWGPAWGWGPSWGWGGGVPVRPYNPRHPGAINRPHYANGHSGYRPAPSGSYRPGSGRYPSGNYRPGTTGNYRPGNSGNYRPGTNGSYTRPGNSSRPTNKGYRPSYNNNDNNSRPSYNNSNTSRPTYNSGSYSRPGRSSGGSFGGGGRHGGVGGGGRGGRR